MELDLQLTPRSRILLGILGGLLLILLVLQGAPAIYRLFGRQDIEVKQEQLLKTKNLVDAAEALRPIESKIYEETGLALASNQSTSKQAERAKTLFDTEPPETVIRSRIDALIRRAGIQQNYQLLTKPGTTKQQQKLTTENRANLVLYHYLKHIEAEETELIEISEADVEKDTFDKLIDAWLSGTGTESDETETQSSDSEPSQKEKERASYQETEINPGDAATLWKFASLPEVIPITLRAKLAGVIREMLTHQLRGATDSKQDFLETQLYKVKTPAVPGIFGIGAKPATVEVQLQNGSLLLETLMQAAEATEDTSEFQSALVQYIEQIQQHRATLLAQLGLAPLTYQTELYTVEMKFKTDLEKLVNLNHLIETEAKWLTVRDLRIAADKQTTGRGRNSEDGTNLNVDMFLIARIF